VHIGTATLQGTQSIHDLNAATPRSSVKMCEKPARSPPNHGFGRQFGA